MEDRADQGYEALDKAIKDVQAESANAPELAGVVTGYKISTPQLSADLNCPIATPANPDDFACLHHGRRPPGVFVRSAAQISLH